MKHQLWLILALGCLSTTCDSGVEFDDVIPRPDSGCSTDLSVFYADEDGDGLGDAERAVEACFAPDGYVDNADDGEPTCATNDTDACGRCGGSGPQTYYADQDEDGLGDPAITVHVCEQPEGFVSSNQDEEPNCATNNTDACGRCGGSGPRRFFADQDGDLLGDDTISIEACEKPEDFVARGGDPEPNCATNNTDDCGVCAGFDTDKDCAGVCFGTAIADGCGVCVGGATGREASVDDHDEDGIPDGCDQCPSEAMARTIIQWTDIAQSSGEGGPYTFQVILFENGDFTFQYRDVEPYEATLTVGYQVAAEGPANSLDVNGDLIRETRAIYYRRNEDGSLSLAPTEPYVWVDIEYAGEVLPLTDEGWETRDIGFDFPFGEGQYNTVTVSANGWLGFAGPWPSAVNSALPNRAYGTFIAPFWDDLDPERTVGHVRIHHLPRGCAQDCAGVFGGVAFEDGCGECVAGTTNDAPDGTRDCSGQCNGLARVDICGVCSGGETGIEPAVPEDCPQGPDLIVDENYLRETVTVEEQEILDPCLIEERCIRGLGLRRLLRFGTRIANIGNEDLQLGRPSEELPHWHWDECHSHFHFLAYAAYELHDVETGERLPYGAKSGFSVIDIGVYDEEIATDGCVGYNAQNQGITAGCQDTYGRGLQCQWIDITGLEDGTYDLIVITNPDAEIPELDYDNNSARVRIELVNGIVRVIGAEQSCNNGVDDDGNGLTDCDDPNCADICALPLGNPRWTVRSKTWIQPQVQRFSWVTSNHWKTRRMDCVEAMVEVRLDTVGSRLTPTRIGCIRWAVPTRPFSTREMPRVMAAYSPAITTTHNCREITRPRSSWN